MTTSVYAFTSEDWAKIFNERSLSHSGLPYWLDGLYKDRTLWSRHVAPTTLEAFSNEFDFDLPKISRLQRSEDGTVKFQIQFKDGMEVETVLIPFYKRFTVCLSTQVGCAMNCSFCFTGSQGLKRHLTAGEIVGQYLVAKNWLLHETPGSLKPSIVFMGQGEPLHNAKAVKKSIEVLNDSKCIGVGEGQITLSTVGYVPGIKTLLDFPKINFALSLHSPFDHERDILIPLNQKYPLDEVLAELDKIPLLKRQFIAFEYLMIGDFNLTDAHADALHSKLGSRKALVNLIPFNPYPGAIWKRPSEEEAESFRKKLISKKLRVMVRNTKGDDILAACGQLNINKMMRNYAN